MTVSHSSVHAVLDSIERDREALLDGVADVGPEQVDRRPAPGAWSIGEVLDHLHRVEAGIAKLVGVRLYKGRAAGTLLPARLEGEEDVAAALASFDEAEASLASPRVAPEIVRPDAGGGRTKAELLAALGESRRALLAAAREGAAYDLAAIRHPHPLLGELDLRQWLLFVGRHERRHARQIAGIREALAADGTSDGGRAVREA